MDDVIECSMATLTPSTTESMSGKSLPQHHSDGREGGTQP